MFHIFQDSSDSNQISCPINSLSTLYAQTMGPSVGIKSMTIIATDEEGQSTRSAKSMMADHLNHSSAFPQPSGNCDVEHKTKQ